MATEPDLLVLVEARVDTLEKQLRKANDTARRNFKDIEGSAQNARRRIEADTKTLAERANANLARIGVGLKPIHLGVTLGGLSAAALAKEGTALADAWTSSTNKLAAAGIEKSALPEQMRAVYQIAQDSRAALGSTADLYAKLLRTAGPLGKTQLEVAKATEIVNKAFAAGGASAAEQASGILQLSQALGSGTLQGDELRSLLENAPLLAKAIADGFGVTVGELKKLGAAGTLESGKVFDAILKGGRDIERQFASTTPTVEAALTRVQNALTKYVGEADGSLGATSRLKAGLNALADDFGKFADIALQAAAVLAAAFVGRSIAGMVAGLGTAAGAVMNLVTALRTLGAAVLGTGLAGIGAAAGPIGAVLGLAAGAALLFMTRADEAAEAAKRAAEGIKELGVSANSTTDDLKKVADQLARLSGAEVRVKVAETSALITARANGLRDTDLSAANVAGGRGPIMNLAKGDFSKLTEAFLRGERTLNSYIAELDALAERFPKLASTFAEAQKQAQEYEAALNARAAQDAALAKQADVDERTLGVASPDYETVAREAANQAALGAERNAAQAAKTIADSRVEAAKSLTEKKIDEQTGKLVKAFEDAGGKITDAIRENFAKEAARSVEVGETPKAAFDMIARFESFRERAYYDVNHWRVGYGSDTTTRADGSIEKVTESTVVSVADAVRDLNRRIAEFQTSARNKVGAETFDALSEEQKAALTSITYNYGELPNRIVRALVGGSTGDVAKAIRGLGNDNAGVNRSRREREAAVYEGSATPAQRQTDARLDRTRSLDRDSARRVEDLDRETEALQRQIGVNGELQNAIAGFNAEAERAAIILREKRRLEDEGIALTPEIIASINARANAEVAAAQRRANAERNVDAIKERTREHERAAQELYSTSRDAFKGFATDLLQGASAGEAFRSALGKIADKLLDMILNQLWTKAFGGIGGAGGGIFGSIATLIGGFSSGGYTGAGGVYEPAGVVHRGEVVWSQKDVARAGGVATVEAMRLGRQGYASGGAVGARVPQPRTVAPVSSPAQSNVITLAPAITVNTQGGGTPEQDAELAKRVSKEVETSMRGLIVNELQKQGRPGGMLDAMARRR